VKRAQLESMWYKLTDEQKKYVKDFIASHITVEEDATNKCEPRVSSEDGMLPTVKPGDTIETFCSSDICCIFCDECNDWFDSDEFKSKEDELFVIEHILTTHL